MDFFKAFFTSTQLGYIRKEHIKGKVYFDTVSDLHVLILKILELA